MLLKKGLGVLSFGVCLSAIHVFCEEATESSTKASVDGAQEEKNAV